MRDSCSLKNGASKFSIRRDVNLNTKLTQRQKTQSSHQSVLSTDANLEGRVSSQWNLIVNVNATGSG